MVEIGGAVASRQGLNIPGEAASLPAVPQEDLEHLRHGEKIGVDLVALSFVRRAEDIEFVREPHPAAADREDREAAGGERAEEIVRAADCVMVARGDLGIEMPIEEVPIVQKQVIALAGALARPSITATQMLDSMVVLVAPDARRGGRRRQRDPRRHRRGDAVPGERRGQVPRRRDRDDGGDRRAHRGRRARTASGRSGACGATAATPPTRSPTRPAAPRYELGLAALVVPDALRPLGAPDLRAPPDRARSTRSRPAARPCAAAG